MRYFLELGYDGTRYCGWQRQLNAPSVQQTLEEALSVLSRREISVTGAGRTDTGVHARYYVAHFDLDEPLKFTPAEFIYKANSILPPDISLYGIEPVEDGAHARFDAIEREYKYLIVPHKDPFRTPFSWQYTAGLDVGQMNRAADCLLTEDTFTTFSKLHSGNKTDTCRASHARWKILPDGSMLFTIRSDRFLRNMVRSIVGTLVDVGRGRITPERFAQILRSRDRSLAGSSAPAQGLFLSDVRYPEGLFQSKIRDTIQNTTL